jgi:hypothetical protein
MRSLMRQRVLDLQYEMLCARTERRQRAAKAALVHRGVVPRTPISTGYVPQNVARAFAYTNVRGLA